MEAERESWESQLLRQIDMPLLDRAPQGGNPGAKKDPDQVGLGRDR